MHFPRLPEIAVEELEPTSKNTGFGGSPNTGGLPGGLRPETLARFIAELRAAGFNGQQLKQIDNALRECGLEVVAVEPVGG